MESTDQKDNNNSGWLSWRPWESSPQKKPLLNPSKNSDQTDISWWAWTKKKLKQSILPVRVASRFGSTLFAFDSGFWHMGVDRTSKTITGILILAGVIPGAVSAKVSYSSRKKDVDDFERNIFAAIWDDFATACKHSWEAAKNLLSPKELAKHLITAGTKFSNITSIPGLILNSFLSFITNANLVLEIFSLFSNTFSRNMTKIMHIIGGTLGVYGGLTTNVIFFAFQGKRTNDTARNIFEAKSFDPKTIFVAMITTVGTGAYAFFSFFSSRNSFVKINQLTEEVFHAKTNPKTLDNIALGFSFNALISAFINKAMANGGQMYEFMDNFAAEKKVIMQSSKTSKSLLGSYYIFSFWKYFVSVIDTLGQFNGAENLTNAESKDLGYMIPTAIIIAAFGAFQDTIFYRKGMIEFGSTAKITQTMTPNAEEEAKPLIIEIADPKNPDGPPVKYQRMFPEITNPKTPQQAFKAARLIRVTQEQ